ncbi:MAG: type II secretion system protein [Patescibacteria group bacterium]
MKNKRGYTLIELVVAVGLFALIMTLASGAYFMVINLNRQVQGVTTGINNLSFALETMVRDIRTGTAYSGGGNSFSFTPSDGGAAITYARGIQQGAGGQTGDIIITKNNVTTALTDPSVDVTSLVFYVYGATPGDSEQPRVTIVVSGSVTHGAGKTESFSVETGATMRGSDI